MIEGMKLRISSDDLRAHLREREEYHRGRQEFYAGQGRQLTEAGEQPQNLTNDPVKAMTDRAAHHRGRADAFATWGRYLIPDEVYQLDNSELSRLEMAYL
jgi:hypothetical protein